MDSNSSKEEIKEREFLEYIRTAADLRLKIFPYQEDQLRLPPNSLKRKVFYAIDTNILYLFLTPQEAGPGEGYGSIFKDDTRIHSTALAAAFAHFIFVKLPQITNRPLIILPGHINEFNDLFERYLKEAQNFLQSKDEVEETRAKRKELFDYLESFSGKNEIDAQKIGEFLFNHENPGVIYLRLLSLFNSGWIAPLDKALMFGNFFDEGDKEKLANIFSQTFSCKSSESWEERLARKAERREKQNLRNDSQALNCVELINRKFHELDEDYLLVLITGDDSLYDAASDCYPFQSKNRSFARHYLRKPKAFVIESPVLLPKKGGETISQKFELSWLDALLIDFTDNENAIEEELSKVVIGDPKTKKKLSKRIKDALKNDDNALENFKERWKIHADNLTKFHFTRGDFALEEMTRVFGKNKIGNTARLLQESSGDLIEVANKTWKEFVGKITPAGLAILTSPTGEFQKYKWRNVPPIIFDRFPKTWEAICQFIGSNNEMKLDQTAFKKLIDMPKDEDPTGYASFLAYSYLQANLDRWYVAGLFAQFAIDIAEDLKLKKSNDKDNKNPNHLKISGREAYYFKAVLQRYLPNLHNETKILLVKAEEAYKIDKEIFPGLSVTNLRFKAEQAILNVCYSLHDFFTGTRKDSIGFKFKAFFYEILAIYSDVDTINNDWIKLSVERSLLAHLFVIALILENENVLNNEITDSLVRLQKTFQGNLEKKYPGGPEFPLSGFVSMISAYAKIRYGEIGDSLKGEAINKLLQDVAKAKFPSDKNKAFFERQLIDQIKLACSH